VKDATRRATGQLVGMGRAPGEPVGIDAQEILGQKRVIGVPVASDKRGPDGAFRL
jgi:hypothetical protein